MQLENYSTKYQVQIQQYELTETQLQFTDYPSNNIQQASDRHHPIVCFNQECASSGRWTGERHLQHALLDHTLDHHSWVLRLAMARRSFHLPLFRHLHHHSHSDGLLDHCVNHVATPEREGPIPGCTYRALPHVQERQ